MHVATGRWKNDVPEPRLVPGLYEWPTTCPVQLEDRQCISLYLIPRRWLQRADPFQNDSQARWTSRSV